MSKKQQLKERDPFDIYLNMGILVSGSTHDLEVFLNDIKAMPEIKLIYSKVSASKLKIEEVKPEDFYPDIDNKTKN